MFTSERTPLAQRHDDIGEPIYTCAQGVPIAWLLLFGARNIWNVGDEVKDRGGAVGERNPYEASIDLALTRLDNAIDILASNEHLWAWYSPAAVLRRKLVLRPKDGYVRLSAPWLLELSEDDKAEWIRATAFLENFINFYGAGREAQAVASIRRLKPFCPFLPEGHGADRTFYFQLTDNKPASEGAIDLAEVVIGTPTDGHDRFRKAIEKNVVPILDDHLEKDLAPSPSFESVRSTMLKKSRREEKPTGLLGKLGGLFKKKG